MAYPTSPATLSETLEAVDRTALDVRRFCLRRIADLSGGNQPASLVLDVHTRLRDAWVRLGQYATVPGLGTYAQSQKSVADIAAEFTAMRSALAGVVTWIEANLPRQGAAPNYLLLSYFTGNTLIERTFTPAETAGLRTQLQAVADTITE